MCVTHRVHVFLFWIDTVDHRHNSQHSNITEAYTQKSGVVNVEHEQRNNHLIWSCFIFTFLFNFFFSPFERKRNCELSTACGYCNLPRIPNKFIDENGCFFFESDSISLSLSLSLSDLSVRTICCFFLSLSLSFRIHVLAMRLLDLIMVRTSHWWLSSYRNVMLNGMGISSSMWP